MRIWKQKYHVLQAEKERDCLEDMMISKVDTILTKLRRVNWCLSYWQDFLTQVIMMFNEHELAIRSVMERHRGRLNDIVKYIKSLMEKEKQELIRDPIELDREKWREDAFERVRNTYDFMLDSDLSVVEEKDEKRFQFEATFFQKLASISSASIKLSSENHRFSLSCNKCDSELDRKVNQVSSSESASSSTLSIADAVKTRRRASGSISKIDEVKRSRIARPKRTN